MALLAVAGAACATRAFAQSEPAVVFTGTSTLSTQYATRQGANQGVPSKYARWDFDPLLGLFGVPLSAHVFLATEENAAGNTINSFGVTFTMDPQQLREFLLRRVRDRMAAAGVPENVDKARNLDSLRAAAFDPRCEDAAWRLSQLEARHERDSAMSADTLKLLDSLRAAKRACDEARARLADAERAKQAVDEADRIRREVQDRGLESITDPARLRSALSDLGLLSGTESFMLNFVTFGIGQMYPNYTPLTLQGIPVNGVDIEFNPTGFYLAGAFGSVQPPALAANLGIMQYGRHLQAARIGYGSKYGTHVILTLLHAQDDGSSVPPDSNVLRDTLGLFPSPQENLVLGTDIRVGMLDDRLTLGLELNGSALTGDTRTADLQNSSIPPLLTNLITPKISSFVDYAYDASVHFADPDQGTRAAVSVRRIGPGYFSLGAPNLRNDRFGIEGKIDQSLFTRQLSLSFDARSEHDNLIDWKSTTTTLQGFKAGVGLTLRKLPSLRIGYALTTQQNDATADSLILDNVIRTLTLSSGYSYPVGTLTAATTATYVAQSGTSHKGLADFDIASEALTQLIAFRFPLSLTGTFSYSDRRAVGDTGIMRALDLSATLTSFDTWQNTLGVGATVETNRGTKSGMYYATQFPIVGDHISGSVRVERNIFAAIANPAATPLMTGGVPTSAVVGDYDEWIVRASITGRW